MAWTTPRTFTTGEIITASILNSHVRDNFNATATGLASAAGQILISGGTNTVGWRGLDGATVDTQETTASTSFTDLSTSGPAVTVTTGTKALITVSCGMSNSSAGAQTMMGYAVSGASAVSASGTKAWVYESGAAGDYAQASFTLLETSLTPGSNTFTAKYAVTAGTGTFRRRKIAVVPFS